MPSCPHCGSPSRLNPCWYGVKYPDYDPGGGDPPCIGDQYDEDHAKSSRKGWRLWWFFFAAAVLALAALWVFR